MPALGPDDDHDRVETPSRESAASDDVADSCSTTARSAPRRAADHLGGRRHLGDLGQPRPPRLLARLARGGPPLRQRLRGPFAAPHPDRARRGPRDDPVDADLGEHLDRELGPVALRDRLHDGHRRGRRGARPRPTTPTRSAPTSRSRSRHRWPRCRCRRPARPAHRPAMRRTTTAWCASSPSTTTVAPAATPVTGPRKTGSDTGQRGLNASRSRPNTDLCGRLDVAVRRLLVAQRRELAQQLLLPVVEPARGLDVDRDDDVAADLRAQVGYAATAEGLLRAGLGARA